MKNYFCYISFQTEKEENLYRDLITWLKTNVLREKFTVRENYGPNQHLMTMEFINEADRNLFYLSFAADFSNIKSLELPEERFHHGKKI